MCLSVSIPPWGTSPADLVLVGTLFDTDFSNTVYNIHDVTQHAHNSIVTRFRSKGVISSVAVSECSELSHQLRNVNFPSRMFGKKNPMKQAFRSTKF